MSIALSDVQLEESVSNEIIGVVNKTFVALFGVSTAASEVRAHQTLNVKAAVSGVIPLHELRAKQVQGTLVLSFPEDTIYGLLTKFYNKPVKQVDNSVKSSVGELTNIIYTTIKKNLNTMGTNLRSAIPSVIVGDDQHEKFCKFNCTTLVIDFNTNFGQFTVYANVERSGG
jgi:CheY-specific phosphatase CheX